MYNLKYAYLYTGLAQSQIKPEEEFNLINMPVLLTAGNGRVYDPLLARFLNADPLIQDNTDAQNYNRYSYVLNNPTKYTDPSGYVYTNYDAIVGARERMMEENRHNMVMQGEADLLSFREMVSINEKGGGAPSSSGGVNEYVEGASTGENDGEPYKISDAERKELKKYGMVPTYGQVITPRSGIVNFANNLNTFGGISTGIFGGAYGFSSWQKFNYAEKIGGRVASSEAVRKLNAFQSLKVSRILGVVGKYSGIAGTLYSASKVVSQFQKGGFNEINNWDAFDTGAGTVGVYASVFLTASNPIGWGIGIGVGFYFGARLVYDLSHE